MYEKLMIAQRAMRKIDTHEHFTVSQFAINSNTDIFDVLLIPYNCDSILSAGCNDNEWQIIMDKTRSFEERFSVLNNYLPLIFQTTFFQASKKTFKNQYSVEEFSLEALKKADSILKDEIKTEHYQRYLDSFNIEKILSFSGYDSMNVFTNSAVLGIPTMSDILPKSREDITRLENACGVKIQNLSTFTKAIDKLFEQYYKLGVRAVKFGTAYRRKLDFAAPNESAAKVQLDRVLSLNVMGDVKHTGCSIPNIPVAELIELDDFLTDYVLNCCEEYNLPVVFHVAMHAWNENDTESCHASHLTQTIRRKPNVRFVLLHSGIPFIEEAVLLARYYKNVFLDMTWMHIISPDLAQTTIRRYLELVPLNKIFAFGGDYCYIQGLYGHLEIAMENFARVFDEQIQAKKLSYEQAIAILNMWYYQNPKSFYNL